jgi:DNA-binding CsgD family transcriptional regulator
MPANQRIIERAGSATGARPPVATEIARLGRQLVRAASKGAPAFLEQADDAVMLDLEADGIRCVVTAHAREAPTRTTLSPREREIVRMVCKGYPTKTIAAVLDISAWTVSTHLRRIFTKLGVRTRAAMVARAIRDGLIQMPEQPTGGQPPAAAPAESTRARRLSKETRSVAARMR